MTTQPQVLLLDGPLGTELNARGVSTTLPLWSAAALESAPEVVAAIHDDYRKAGATVHTANTFRTKSRTVGQDWRQWTELAVGLARAAIGSGRLAGSLSPLEDCYRPDLSPPECRGEHRQMAQALVAAGCDLLLCETFPHVGEACVAVEEGVRCDVEVWVAFTAGPEANLLTPEQMAEGAARAVSLGASAVLVNCVPASRTLPYVQALAEQGLSVPLGAYANAGRIDEQIGWTSPQTADMKGYLEFAKSWVAAGATILGGCCGTGPAHLQTLRDYFNPS